MIRPQAALFGSLLALVLLATAASAYASAASNSAGLPQGGGEARVHEAAVTRIHYTLAERDPSLLQSVSFQLSAPRQAADALTIHAQLTPNGAWFACQPLAGQWTCPLNQSVSVRQVTTLRVIVTE